MGKFLALWLAGYMARVTKDEEGQGLAEYALILVFIAIVCIIALTALGTSVSNVLNNVAGNLASGS